MANCNHPGATCVIGNFYTCKTPGCENGPALPPKLPSPPTAGWYVTTFAPPGLIVDLCHYDKFTAKRVKSKPGWWKLFARPGYVLSWDKSAEFTEVMYGWPDERAVQLFFRAASLGETVDFF